MPPRKAAANPDPNRLTWVPASISRPGDLRFTAQPHPDFKADMAATAETDIPGVLLVVKSGMRTVASRPEYRQVHADFDAAKQTADEIYADWLREYARDGGRRSAAPPVARPPNGVADVAQADVLARLNARPGAAAEPAPEPEPAAE